MFSGRRGDWATGYQLMTGHRRMLPVGTDRTE